MRKKIIKTFLAFVLITSVFSMTVLGDEVSDLKREQEKILKDLDSYERQVAELAMEIDRIELQIADKYEEYMRVEEQLADEEKKLQEQYNDMKLRIKYMYEEQSASISEVLLAAGNIGEVLNKVEYAQQVYNYDRKKLEEISATVSNVKTLRENVGRELEDLEKLSSSITAKKSDLEKAMASLRSQSGDYDRRIANAIQKAAEAAALRQQQQQQQQQQSGGTVSKYPMVANNNSSIANSIVSDAQKYLGVKYVYGGSTPSGFDCSGFTQYLFKQYGLSLPRSAAGQLNAGQKISGLSEAQPGDIICYPGHVALYIGNNMVIHAPYTGTVVRVQNVNMMTIIGIRRYW